MAQPTSFGIMHKLACAFRGAGRKNAATVAATEQNAPPRANVAPIILVTDIPFWENTIGSHMRIQGLVRTLSAIAPLHGKPAARAVFE